MVDQQLDDLRMPRILAFIHKAHELEQEAKEKKSGWRKLTEQEREKYAPR